MLNAADNRWFGFACIIQQITFAVSGVGWLVTISNGKLRLSEGFCAFIMLCQKMVHYAGLHSQCTVGTSAGQQ